VNRLRRCLAVPLREKWFAFCVYFLIWAVRLSLWVVPFRLILKRVRVVIPSTGLAVDSLAVGRVSSRVKQLSAYVPRATCLTQALTTMILLKRAKQPASLILGVAKETENNLIAHAWVESAGSVVVGGGKDLTRFSLLVPGGRKT
jgi:hypothetical protein